MTYTISIDDTKNWEILRQKLNGFLAAIDTRLTTDETAITDLTAHQDAVLLSSGSFTTAQATLDIALPAGYGAYRLLLTNCDPATDNVSLGLRVSIDNGSTYKAGASDYSYAWLYNNTSAVSSHAESAAAATLLVSGAQGSATGYNSTFQFDLYNSASANFVAQWSAWYIQSGGAILHETAAGRAIYPSVTNVRFLFSSGNIARAKWALYGVKGL